MRYLRSFKFTVLQNRRWVRFRHDRRISYYYRKWPPAAIAYVLCILIFTAAAVISHGAGQAQTPNTNNKYGFGSGIRIPLPKGRSLTLQSRATPIGTTTTGQSSGAQTPSNTGMRGSTGITHSNIVTTYFWVGEPGDADNDYIANSESAWDGNWEADYGGVDSPPTGRTAANGYLPSFTPKENPFYFALPYSDIDDNGNRKATAVDCPLYATMKNSSYSWCKNSWIAITHNGKTAYAQWEDVGPFEEDDTAYVFGSAAPENTEGAKAGLDVSPAVEGYLGLTGEDNCSWYFVAAGSVPSGVWNKIITTDPGDNTVN